METFVWAITIFFGLDILGRMVMLGTGVFPPRTPKQVVWDLLLNLCMMLWAIVLLVKGG